MVVIMWQPNNCPDDMPGRPQDEIHEIARRQRDHASKSHIGPTLLSSDFVPGSTDVICARGKRAKNHIGNIRFRQAIREVLDNYQQARTKATKSAIVTHIVDFVRNSSPVGAFVRRNDSGLWYEVGNVVAREKIGQCIRDLLHTEYKSSTKAKKLRRVELRKKKLRKNGDEEDKITADVATSNSDVMDVKGAKQDVRTEDVLSDNILEHMVTAPHELLESINEYTRNNINYSEQADDDEDSDQWDSLPL